MRITIKDLEQCASTLNNMFDSTDKLRAQVGNFHISGAYGGYSLHQITNRGGERDVLRTGHVPARELYNRMTAYIRGIDDERLRAKVEAL